MRQANFMMPRSIVFALMSGLLVSAMVSEPAFGAPTNLNTGHGSPTLAGAFQRAEFIASDAAANDYFGDAVAVSGDTAVVGAFSDDTADGINAGSAYVFVRSGTVWTEQAHLTASDGAASDYFASSVAVDGDTAVVGARFDNTAGGTDAGSAYVFVRSGTVWTEQAHLIAADGAGQDLFGESVALSGDTAVVGASLDDTARGTNAGSTYVFVRFGTIWTQQAHLTASDGAVGDELGVSVALDGDTAATGAYANDTSGGANAGSAYVFVRSGTIWTEQADLTASNGVAGDEFGFSVAVDGNTAVTGAIAHDTSGGTDAGSAYVFVRSGTVWAEQAYLTASNGAAIDYFGGSVALSGDTGLVGADHDDTSAGADAGSAYVFVRSGAIWTRRAHLKASDGAASDYFGHSVGVSGRTTVIGADFHDIPAGVDAGSAYVAWR